MVCGQYQPLECASIYTSDSDRKK